MTADELNRPAAAGRVVWAVAASLLAHALLISATAGRSGDGDWTSTVTPQPRPVLSATLSGATADTLAISGTPPETATATEAAPAANRGEQPGNSIGSVAGLAPPTHYYPARELDIRPQIRSQVEPAYPRTAFEQGQAGSVRLRILVDAQGRVDGVAPQGREVSDPFTAAAITAFRAARYTPGVKNGVPVPSEVVIEVQFETFSAAETFRGNSY